MTVYPPELNDTQEESRPRIDCPHRVVPEAKLFFYRLLHQYVVEPQDWQFDKTAKTAMLASSNGIRSYAKP